jgi:class 3 adenylate cyclase
MDRPAIFGWESASTLAILFAATHPERTRALITFGSNPCGLAKPDWPYGWDEHDAWEPYFARALEGWGTLAWTTEYMETYEPDSVQLAPLMLHMFQLAASPTTGTALERIDMGTDIRHVLPTVRVPTLVLYRSGGSEPEAVYEYLGERIAGAKVVALPGRDDTPWLGDVDTIVEEVEEFLTGVRHGVVTDRVLATVLFTDIVDSTAQAVTLGDARWKECLVAHDDLTRREVDRHHGRYVKQTGDGLLAIFDGPARAVRCAQAIMSAVRSLGIQIRAGVHTGEVELGLNDVHGIAVHLGARVMSLAKASEILTSSTVKDLTVGSGLAFEDVGEHELKGAPDHWQLYRVTGG